MIYNILPQTLAWWHWHQHAYLNYQQAHLRQVNQYLIEKLMNTLCTCVLLSTFFFRFWGVTDASEDSLEFSSSSASATVALNGHLLEPDVVDGAWLGECESTVSGGAVVGGGAVAIAGTGAGSCERWRGWVFQASTAVILSQWEVRIGASRLLMVSFAVGYLAWTLQPGARAML